MIEEIFYHNAMSYDWACYSISKRIDIVTGQSETLKAAILAAEDAERTNSPRIHLLNELRIQGHGVRGIRYKGLGIWVIEHDQPAAIKQLY